MAESGTCLTLLLERCHEQHRDPAPYRVVLAPVFGLGPLLEPVAEQLLQQCPAHRPQLLVIASCHQPAAAQMSAELEERVQCATPVLVAEGLQHLLGVVQTANLEWKSVQPTEESFVCCADSFGAQAGL